MAHPETQEATQCTQGAMDPRRLGRYSSGLPEADVSDVMCILHPCSPAAFKIVATTAECSPHNVLQSYGTDGYDDGVTESMLEEQETFILNTSDGANSAMDLALRFSTETINPPLGFVFGRNPKLCDIVLATDTCKRVSNVHFSIWMNHSGVLMLQDMSTNGTMVDDVVLRGKPPNEPQTRMLSGACIVQILSPKPEEIVKFIVRIPPREGYEREYAIRFEKYMHRMGHPRAFKAKHNDRLAIHSAAVQPKTQSASSYKAPLVQNQYGMHWSGGDKYNVVGLIGKGAFAPVYQLATKSEGQLYAAKELEKRKFMKNGILDRKLDNEMQIMKSISHANIVQYVDYHDVGNHLYIIMEFIPCGDLQQYLGNMGVLPEFLGNKMARQVLDALAYLHAKRITHRDIKPDNILLADMEPDTFTIKLSDFGLSKVVKDNDTFLKTFCGTLLYCAPEVFPHYDTYVTARGQKRTRKGSAQPPTKFHSYSQSVDIWSFGAVLWFSLCMKPPFEGVADNTGRGMFDKIMMTPLDVTDLLKQGISDNAIALLTSMLNTDPSQRPLPRECLQSQWFEAAKNAEYRRETQLGGSEQDDGMYAIYEEDENEAAEQHPDLSRLNLEERDNSYGSQDSRYDDASIHSGSLNFLDPRQSKRLKSDVFTYREPQHPDEMVDSSPELFHRKLIPMMHRPDNATSQKAAADRPKLFGEISQSALNAPAYLGMRANAAVGNSGSDFSEESSHASTDSALEAQHVALRQAGALASPSLLGAESLMRDINMNSPQSADPPAAEPYETNAPGTPVEANFTSTPQLPNDVTPKPAQQPKFRREINVPKPPSFRGDPNDETTHTLAYASRKSGHDYVENPSYIIPARVSLPDTASGEVTDQDHEDVGGDTDAETDGATSAASPSESAKPLPRLGRLVSTPDSFAQITLNLNERTSSWGRAPSCTHSHPDKFDTRIPKVGMRIWFHGKNIENVAEQNDDWLKLPGLHCVINTEANSGIRINGVELMKSEPGKARFGRIYTGDEITVVYPQSDGKPVMRFVCEFYHGEGKKPRPADGPRFKVETEGPKPPRKTPGKGKERAIEEENVLVDGKLAVVA